MSLKKFGVTMLALVVLGAIAASSAFAENEFKETGGAWYTGASPGTKLAEGTSKTLTVAPVGEKQTLETTVAGLPLDITAKKVACSGTCTIKNVGTKATIDGALVFSELTVSNPANCTTTSTITSKALTAILGMNTAGTKAILKFTPETGTTFAVVELLGASCPISGTYKVTGSVFGEASNATGVFGVTQQVNFSKTIQEAQGTATSLKFGENSAILTGALNGSIGGTEWAGKEK
jgi:hypothetical protein